MRKKLYEHLKEKGIDDAKHRERLEMELKEFKKYETINHTKLIVEIDNGAEPSKRILIWYLLGYIHNDPIDKIPENIVVPGKAPDIDLDFEDAERGRVIDYIKRRFGYNNVAQVCNVVTYSIKSAFQDAARIYGIPAQKAISISKNINDDNWNQSDAYTRYPEIFKFAEHLLGQMRNYGRHAAAIIITDKPVQKYIPCQYNKDDDILLAEFTGAAIQDIKLLKLDILGLSTLKIMKDTIEHIKERHNKEISLGDIDFNDLSVFKLFSHGLTTSIFQFESPSMKGYLQKLKPKELEDIVVMNALFRPGAIPIINNYIKRKHGKEKIEYGHSVLEKVLKPTFGLLVFQEETIMIAHLASGISLGRADMLRRYMEKWNSKYKNDIKGKKKWESEFFQGCQKQGLNSKESKYIWDYLIKQTGYQFNRCVSGDCIIDADTSNKWRPTIGEMYRIKNDTKYAKETNHYPLMKRYCGKKGYGKSYSLCEDGLLRLNNIVDIYYEGDREVFEILLEDGKKIEVTGNHNFPLPNGQKLNIDNGLKAGDHLYVNEGYKKRPKGQKVNEPTLRQIVSIKSVGIKDTYNIEMAAPNHTLSINGIITSNSHALSYAVIAYQTAWLKVHYPVEFMCASLNSDKTPIDKLTAECAQLGIKVLYPNINKSKIGFSIVDDRTIIYGLSSVKNCGEVPAQWITAHAPYESVTEFFTKLKDDKFGTKVNKRVLDSLILSGAFSDLYKNTKTLFNNYNEWRKKWGKTDFETYIKGKEVEDYNDDEKSNFLQDLLSIDTSMALFEKKSKEINQLRQLLGKGYIIGIITDFVRKRDRNGNMMAFVSIRDGNGIRRYPLFARQFANNSKNLIKNKILAFKMSNMRDGDRLITSIMQPDTSING